MKKKFYQDEPKLSIQRGTIVFVTIKPDYWTEKMHIRFAVLTAKVIGVHEYWKGRKTGKSEIAVTFKEDDYKHLYCVPVDRVFWFRHTAHEYLNAELDKFKDSLYVGENDKEAWEKRGR